MKNWLSLNKIDWIIVAPAVFLTTVGFLLQSSIAYKTVGVELDINLFTQVIALAGGVLAGALLLMFKTITWRRYMPLIFIAVSILLILVLVSGSGGGGAQRWIEFGSFRFQPTEIAKLTLILALATTLDTHALKANKLSTVILSLLLTVIFAALVAFQPDLGSAVVMVVIWLAMLLASRIKLGRYAFVVISLVATALVLTPFLAEYQQERLVSYFNPTRDVSGANYNVAQAAIALGSGGITGNGLEAGSQSQLNFLPSQHTDFIFAVLGEKLGLIGTGLVLIAFTVLLSRIIFRAWQTKQQFLRLIFIGVASVIAFHAIVNIGMNVGLMPVTGLPLPYLSYGGTFLFVVTMLTVVVAGFPEKVVSD